MLFRQARAQAARSKSLTESNLEFAGEAMDHGEQGRAEHYLLQALCELGRAHEHTRDARRFASLARAERRFRSGA